MREFLDDLPINFWGSYVMIILGFVSLCYVVYFYLSREGRDERGRGIFASASAITFIMIFIISFSYDHLIDGDVSYTAFSFLNYLLLSLMTICQAFSILILKKIR